MSNKIIERAKHLVEQYDKYDRFRETEADKSLYNFGEPDTVAISRELLRLVEGKEKRLCQRYAT